MKYSLIERIRMVFSPKRLEQAIDSEVQANSKEWQKYLHACHTEESDMDCQPFVARECCTKKIILSDDRRSWKNDTVLFQQRTSGKAMEFTPDDMKQFWDQATMAIGSYLLEQGYGRIVLSKDPVDENVRVANVKLNVYKMDK